MLQIKQLERCPTRRNRLAVKILRQNNNLDRTARLRRDGVRSRRRLHLGDSSFGSILSQDRKRRRSWADGRGRTRKGRVSDISFPAAKACPDAAAPTPDCSSRRRSGRRAARRPGATCRPASANGPVSTPGFAEGRWQGSGNAFSRLWRIARTSNTSSSMPPSARSTPMRRAPKGGLPSGHRPIARRPDPRAACRRRRARPAAQGRADARAMGRCAPGGGARLRCAERRACHRGRRP